MEKPPHIAILPSPGMGHLIPLVEFANRLILTQHNLSITFIIPNDGPLSKSQSAFLDSLPNPINYLLLPPVSFDDLPKDAKIETRISLMVTRSIPSIQEIFNTLIADKKIVALFVDLFGTDAFDVATQFGVPQYDRNNDAYKWVLHNAKRYMMAKGIVVNSFKELEGGAIEALQQDQPGKPPVYPVGPLIQTAESSRDVNEAKMNDSGIVDRMEIARVVKGLLEGEEGKGIRVRIRELKEAAANVLSKDRYSTKTLDQLASTLKNNV
ncbi:hypothetical protein L6452_20410 [Arctium lappa]|uniref:Uncharacterized protein n=1 Tax=Arctium lappa TaxID=4217 RepID=A0ACB9BBB8_ARCLA|nr:hypothetical protein L6452_20410 [Arctium lappa]